MSKPLEMSEYATALLEQLKDTLREDTQGRKCEVCGCELYEVNSPKHSTWVLVECPDCGLKRENEFWLEEQRKQEIKSAHAAARLREESERGKRKNTEYEHIVKDKPIKEYRGATNDFSGSHYQDMDR